MTSGGLPHSGTRGSTPADGSPRLVAAFRALHRPSTPRHPPCARRSSASMLAHDAEPTGSTHVHHSALVNVPETPASLVRAIHRHHGGDASHEPRLDLFNDFTANKNGPTVAEPHIHAHTRSTLPALQLRRAVLVNCRLSVCPYFRALDHSSIARALTVKGSRELSGGDGRIRTPDLPRARRALSH